MDGCSRLAVDALTVSGVECGEELWGGCESVRPGGWNLDSILLGICECVAEREPNCEGVVESWAGDCVEGGGLSGVPME